MRARKKPRRASMQFRPLFTATVVVALGLSACTRKPEPSEAPPAAAAQPANLPALIDTFIEAHMKRDPYFAVQAGRHEFDGQMADWSRAALDADIVELRGFKAQFTTLDPATLSEEQRFERDYVVWVIDRELFWMDNAGQPFNNPVW